MVNRNEVAKLAGVSAMTVSRVVSKQDNVSLKTKEKVLKAIETLNYVPNKIASNLVSRKNNTIAIVVPDLTNSYYLEVVDAMVTSLKSENYIVSLFKANKDDMDKVLGDLLANRVMGIVNYSCEFPVKFNKMFSAAGTKVIRGDFLHNDIKMQIDYSEAMKHAIDVMVSRGKKRFVFFAGMNEEDSRTDQRRGFFLSYLAEKGIILDEDCIIYGDYPYKASYLVGKDSIMQVLKNNKVPEVVICINDMMAMGVINALRNEGIKVPDEVSVIGFDNILLCSLFNPAISTISLNIKKEAQIYVDYLIKNKNDKEYKLCATFIERDSTSKKVI